MNRNHLLYALPPLALATSCSEQPKEPARPNILLIDSRRMARPERPAADALAFTVEEFTGRCRIDIHTEETSHNLFI